MIFLGYIFILSILYMFLDCMMWYMFIRINLILVYRDFDYDSNVVFIYLYVLVVCCLYLFVISDL